MDFWPDGTDRAPVLTDAVVLENDRYIVRELWRWNIGGVCPAGDDSGLLSCLVAGYGISYNGVSTFIREDGSRIRDEVYPFSRKFSCGRALVRIEDRGFGFIDTDMRLVIPPIYDQADSFYDGYAVCRRGDVWRIVDTSGVEAILEPDIESVRCVRDGVFLVEEKCSVSCRSDWYEDDMSDFVGRWQYVDAHGAPLTERDLLYARPFEHGIATAARAAWTRVQESAPGAEPHYRASDERWGAIDSTGRVVIPFIFDDLYPICFQGPEAGRVFGAHFGGWESGAWGVVDATGKWLAEPRFGSLCSDFVRGRFTFCMEPEYSAPCGAYDVREGRVILPDVYDEIELLETGDMWTVRGGCEAEGDAEPDPEGLARKVLDASGAVKFDCSKYDWIRWQGDHYVATLRGSRMGVALDIDGRPVDCAPIVFYRDGGRGIQDARGRVLVEASYSSLIDIGDGLYIANDGEKSGVVDARGEALIPPKYRSIARAKSGLLVCSAPGDCAAYRIDVRGKIAPSS